MTSATSSSANPISDVTLWGTDSVRVSAAFFSPNHSYRRSLSHHVASIAVMNTWWLRGSNRIRFISGMSARMKSSSAVPDFPRMSRCKAAIDACVPSMSSITMAGSGSIGVGAPANGGVATPSSSRVGTKSPRSTMVCSASPTSGSDRHSARRLARLDGDAKASATSTNSRPAASYIGRKAMSWNIESPSGFMGSVIICWWPTETKTWLSSSATSGMGNRVVIGRLWTNWKSSSARHHSMSCGEPKWASMRRPRSASRTTCASVNAGCAWRAGSISCSCVPPAGAAWTASCLVAIAVVTISPSRTVETSTLTRPETSASPRPTVASTKATFRFDVMGSAVNRTPAASGKTICCTTTAISTVRWSTPLRTRYVTARSV